jgi:hypothetical protein
MRLSPPARRIFFTRNPGGSGIVTKVHEIARSVRAKSCPRYPFKEKRFFWLSQCVQPKNLFAFWGFVRVGRIKLAATNGAKLRNLAGHPGPRPPSRDPVEADSTEIHGSRVKPGMTERLVLLDISV